MSEQSLNLLHVEPGRPAVIREVTGAPQLRARLNELGFTPGVTVSLVAKVSFGGPLAFRLRDTTVALRRTDAACVLVTT